MSKLRQRSIFGILLVVLGAAMFTVASAFVIARGYPKIVAGIVGGLAFPVLPVAWQIWGERKRKAKLAAEAAKPKPKKPSTLTAYDRFWLRFVGVAIVVIGPMIFVARQAIVMQTVDHALWYLPQFVPGIGYLGEGPRRDLSKVEPLLRRVPSDAELVVVALPSTLNGEGMLAISNHDMVAAGQDTFPRDDDTIRRVNDAFKTQHELLVDPIAMVIDRDITVASTDRWKTKVEPAPNGLSGTLRRELERAPADAVLFVALQPRGTELRDAKLYKSGAIWAAPRTVDKKVVIGARFDTKDVMHAYELVTELRSLHGDALPLSSDCKKGIDVKDLDIAQVGNVVTAQLVMSDTAFAQCLP
ncbi:MAG: hypothetical protein QM831_33525 [Kofleriaceae bacterium]